MLEGAVARLLNHLLGKYVVDLDTENLNVGIFSGQVQLTDLKLKIEALYELGLPVEVKAGSIGKIRLQIPWTTLWSQPVIINIEDVHIVFGPIITNEPVFDPEKNKRLIRAFKRKILEDLESKVQLKGFVIPEQFLTNVLNSVELTVSNVHVRYEDSVSYHVPIAAGLCIGNITADSTNSKWKPAKCEPISNNCYYLVKIETLSTYWNCNSKLTKWDLPQQYYSWRNAMSSSLANFSMNGQNFNFVLKPMTTKMKITLSKSEAGAIEACSSDVIVQDCNLQISKNQYDSMLAVVDLLQRTAISWEFLAFRPREPIRKHEKIWWKYALRAVTEQRIKPYQWRNIRKAREDYRQYLETYKRSIANPNDTELKLDLQQHEDDMKIVPLVVARRQARLESNSVSTESSFWSVLSSPSDRVLDQSEIEYRSNFRVSNTSAALLLNNGREILIAAATQIGVNIIQNSSLQNSRVCFKVQGFTIEGCTVDDHLTPILASQHSHSSCFKTEIERVPKDASKKFSVFLDSLEYWHNRKFLDDVRAFFGDSFAEYLWEKRAEWPKSMHGLLKEKLEDKWEICLNIKPPVIIIPEFCSSKKAESILIIDMGRFCVTTELCQNAEKLEHATQMELEEQLYTKLHIECCDQQVLFCQNEEAWKDAKKEKDTDLHLVPKTSFSATYAICAKDERTLPSYKFNINFHTLKLNTSERRIGQLLKFLTNTKFEGDAVSSKFVKSEFCHDRIQAKPSLKQLARIQSQITIHDGFTKSRSSKAEAKRKQSKAEKQVENRKKEDMNEVYAKYVDLPGLEDNISPHNVIVLLLGVAVKEFSIVFSRSSDSSDREYLMLRLDVFTMDVALMTYGPAYQISLNSILLTDKLHTTPSGQYLDLIYTPFPSTVDVVTILYRKVDASCPDFWSYFHGVETSLVADLGTIHLLLHQEALHTIMMYSKYLYNKIEAQLPQYITAETLNAVKTINSWFHKHPAAPVPPGSVKFSQSVRIADVHVRICDSDFDIISMQLSGFEIDFLFRANERFVFRSYLGNINVEHLSEVTLYSKVLSTDQDKVFEMKYVRHASHISDVSPSSGREGMGGSFKFQLGQIHVTFLYKLVAQLQRFIANLEAVTYANETIDFFTKTITGATETLKANTKINLAINICGPIILFPQKSSSPNVILIDTGDLSVENFFKDYDGNDVTENILVKWTAVTVTRGVMTMTSTIEMQETLVEPVNMYVDIKRYTNVKNAQKTWDIDGVLEPVQITLGQRDIATLMSIYTDNVGEGKILDLFPAVVEPSQIVDEDIKNLEVFFCDPKQKHVVAKFSLEEVSVLLFFDSAELLSSPIRDLNHGLCNFKVTEVSTLVVVYNDGSLDGKLSAESVLIEEVGPDVNVYDKRILQATVDDNKNNNCNITINRAPIIDVTCYQNNSGDKSADVIIGRLTFSLSVPFCEKLALFVLECLPKDNSDFGIVNQGYECDLKQFPDSDTDRSSDSLTVSLRINKPEFIFVVETTSNKKRYFTTHAEILADYSRHSNRLNLVLSLSGLHSLFYDIGANSSEPYAILKHCDVEFSKCYSEEKGKKIIASVSSIYVQICSKVVHSLTDILNDIAEHFKVPEIETTVPSKETKQASKEAGGEDLWESKKMGDFSETHVDDFEMVLKEDGSKEILLVPKFDIVLVLELEETQVVLFKSTLEVTIYDWSSLLNSICEFTIQANYFNENLQTWEPFIEPVVTDEKEYKPWDLLIKVFQDKSMPILDTNANKTRRRHTLKDKTKSYTTTEDEDSGEDMMYLEPTHPTQNRINRRVKTSLSTFLDDSDSENEDGTMEKLAAAISDLFTGDWNENEDSDYNHSSGDNEDDSDEMQHKSDDNAKVNFTKSTYILIDAKETLNFSITPVFLKVLNEIFTTYSNKTLSVIASKKSINLTNDIGPQSKVELYEKKGDQEDVLLNVKTFENQDSPPNSPTKNYFVTDYGEDDSTKGDSKSDFGEINYDFQTLASLQFPSESTAQLYDKTNKNFIKVHIPNFHPTQTNCSKRNWNKLMKVQSVIPGQSYYIAARHFIGKSGRNLIISSPLQIKNETHYALSVLYQPSVLQQLNLEPLGDVTNPFETTMRITVLEAHESYNVPLYIAYHCRLFIQPAYSEGHYTSDSGIWWKDLATELDIAHNLHCRPRSDSNLELFSLRVMLKKNLEVENTQAHSVPNYVIHVLQPLILHNFLPYSLEVEASELKQPLKVEPGDRKSVYSLDISKDQKLTIRVKHNLLVWTGYLNFTTYLDEKFVAMSSDAKDSKHLTINVRTDREGSCNLFFYAPYWIINKTGLPLQIRASATNTIYESSNEDILLFTYRRHGKQTLNVRVYESNWSNEFGLECAGATGLIICRNNERRKKYLFFLSIKLSQICPRLTKIVTLLPSFLVSNNTNKNLRFMEHNEKTDLWTDIGPNQMITFWPETSAMQMYVKYRDSKLISQAFNIAITNRTVLRMDKGGALTVEVTGGVNDSFTITFLDYKLGDAPVLVKNYCADLFLKIQQQEESPVQLLSPFNSLLYTWDDPTKIRKIVWNVYNNKGAGFSVDIAKDTYGEEKIRLHSITPTSSVAMSSSSDDSDSSENNAQKQNSMPRKVRKDKIVIYWLCYRRGLQRILLFTQELRIYQSVLKNYFLENCSLESLVSLSGVCCSIFTSENPKKEHVCATLADAPALWEVNVGHKWKTLTLELAAWIEDKYKMHYKKCQLKDYIHIDFEKMFMLKPFFAELKRTYIPAVYFQFRKSSNFQHVNLKIHQLQVDNKLSNTIVLHPTPGGNFVEVNLLKYSSKDCDVYRYIKTNIGSFSLDIESDLWTDLCQILTYYKRFYKESTVSYVIDMKSIQDLNNKVKNGQHFQSIIEYLSVNSFEIQLHISNKTPISLTNAHLPFCRILDYLFPINISPYMPMEGIVHKISSVEHIYVKGETCATLKSLLKQLTSQFLQQYYSHVLGLQVLVNAFAIQSEAKESLVELGKMANILLYGFRCLLSHINMSPAALEQCVLDIFANQSIENIQRIRRHGPYKKSEVVPKFITASCRNFHSGVPNALNQLIVKQQSTGVNYDGEVFFRTTGKALLSLVTRHPDEKSDSVDVAKEALRRASLLGEPIRIQQRLTRYCNRYLGLKPFSVYESMGQNLLETVANCRFINDTYWSHASTDKTGKSILLVSLQHVIRINKCRPWGVWEVEWAIDLDDIISMPKIIANELIFNMRKSENYAEEHLKIIGEQEMLTWIHEKIEQAIIVSMEEKSWAVVVDN